MIKPVLHTIILLFTIVSLKAQQNLVPNPSFEEYWECPTAPDNGDGQLEKCKYWYKPNYATSDYMNNCASINSGVSTPSNFIGNQTAFEGNAYISLYFYSQSTESLQSMEFRNFMIDRIFIFAIDGIFVFL
mgnify:CR=1 FL=1